MSTQQQKAKLINKKMQDCKDLDTDEKKVDVEDAKVEQKKEEQNLPKLKILFLDIDGVLNTLPSSTESSTNPSHYFPQIRLKRLKNIIDSTNCKIVLSSSWRLRDFSKKTLWEKFESIGIDVKTCYIGDTPSIKKARAFQIETYLNEIKSKYEISHWCAVDDMELDSTQQTAQIMKDHFVKTEIATGLTDAKMNEIISILNME